MTIRTILFSLVFSAIAATAQTTAPVTPRQQADAYYQQGLAAEKAGDPNAARAAYGAALRVNPQHTNSRFRLGQLRSTSGTIAAKGRQSKIGAVVIPEIKLDNASLAETVEFLAKLIERESEGEIAPNFVIQDPKNQMSDARITLQLKNVPTTAVLEYVTNAANAKIRYDEHAVVIEPR